MTLEELLSLEEETPCSGCPLCAASQRLTRISNSGWTSLASSTNASGPLSSRMATRS